MPTNVNSESRIAIQQQHPAYWLVVLNPPPDYPGETVPLSALRENPERHLGPLQCQPGLTPELAYQQILEVVLMSPGVPLGLTFDGGIAVTYTDYHLAVKRWERLQPSNKPSVSED